MGSGTTTVRVASDTADRMAALRKDRGGSSDDVVREALDALYWSRMAEASRRLSSEHREGVSAGVSALGPCCCD